MTLNDTAAAYGLFQVAYAHLIDQLAVATFRLRTLKEPDLDFNTVFRQPFKRTLDEFQQNLARYEHCPSVSDSLAAAQGACSIMSRLAVWRNDRVHARIHWTEEGYVLYDWRTRKRLTLTPEQIQKNIELAIKAIVDLETHVPHLVSMADWDDEVERLFSTVPGLSEGDDESSSEVV